MRITKEFTLHFDANPDLPRSKKLKVIITIRDATTDTDFIIVSIDGDKKKEVKCNTLEQAVERYEEIKL